MTLSHARGQGMGVYCDISDGDSGLVQDIETIGLDGYPAECLGHAAWVPEPLR